LKLEYFISDMRACDKETEYVLIPQSFGRILVEGLGKRGRGQGEAEIHESRLVLGVTSSIQQEHSSSIYPFLSYPVLRLP